MAAIAPTKTAATTTDAKPTGSSVVLLFIGLMVTMLMAAMNQTVLSTALPTIVGELGGVNEMSWVITAYILASTVTMPVYGRISDQFGRKPVLLVAIMLFIAGSIVGALSQNIWWLVGARVLQGIGGGGLMILSQAAIADVVPARERGKYMGFLGGVFALSSVAGPLLGGWITEGPGWRWAFWINLPLGALSIVATLLFLRLPKRPARTEKARIDYGGMTVLAAATAAVVLVCTWGGHTYEWNSPVILGLIAAAVVLAVVFVLNERKAAQPVIPLALFKDRNFTISTIAALLIGIAMFGALGYFPTYLQMVTGVGATEAGLMMAPMMGAMLITSIMGGWIVSKTGRYKIFPIMGALIMGAGLWLMSALTVETPIWWMCTVLAVFGVGLGLSNQILTLIVQNSFSNRIVGTATAANNYFRQVGASVGSAIVGSFFVSRLHDLLAERLAGAGDGAPGADPNSLTPEVVASLPDAVRIPIIQSYNEALLPIFLLMVPLALVTLLLLFFIVEKPLATTVEDEVPAESLATGQIIVPPVDDGADASADPSADARVGAGERSAGE